MTKQCTICKVVKTHIGNKVKGYCDENLDKWNNSWCPACASEYYKNYRVNNNLNKGGFGQASCKTCGVIFSRHSSRHAYCSLKCKTSR